MYEECHALHLEKISGMCLQNQTFYKMKGIEVWNENEINLINSLYCKLYFKFKIFLSNVPKANNLCLKIKHKGNLNFFQVYPSKFCLSSILSSILSSMLWWEPETKKTYWLLKFSLMKWVLWSSKVKQYKETMTNEQSQNRGCGYQID